MPFGSISVDACKQNIVCWEEKYIFNDFECVSKVIVDLVIVLGFGKLLVLLNFAITSCNNVLKYVFFFKMSDCSSSTGNS